jgi:uncharacterized membrane protein
MFNKHRVESLSDGIFAIAMTLLILDIKVPVDVAPGQFAAALRATAPEWFGFGITFLLTSMFWVLQHRVFDLVDEIDMRALVPTFVTLGLVCVLPFSTSLMSHHGHEPLAFAVYFGNQLLIAVALTVKLELANLRHRLPPSARLLRFRLYGSCAIMVLTLLASIFLSFKGIMITVVVAALSARLLRTLLKRKLEAAPTHKKLS